MLQDLVRERDEARAEVARLRAMIADSKVLAVGVNREPEPALDVGMAGYDPDLASPPSYGLIALACERAREEAAVEALGLN